MASQTRAVNNTLHGGWANPDNAFLDDDQCTSTKDDMYNNRYNFINNPFSIPAGATINGVQLRIRRSGDGGDILWIFLTDANLSGRLRVDTPPSANCANAVMAVGGGPTDLWGGVWTAEHINSADFECEISYLSNGKANFMYVDYIEVTIYYTTGPVENHLRIGYRRPAANLYCYRPISGLTDGFELLIDSEYDVTVGVDDYVTGLFALSKDNDGSRHNETEMYGIRGFGEEGASKHGLRWWNGVGAGNSLDGDADPNSDRFIYRIRKQGTRLEYYCSSPNVADNTVEVSSGIPSLAYMKAWISSSIGGNVDDDCEKKIYIIRIRKWVYPEPTHGDWGAEEEA